MTIPLIVAGFAGGLSGLLLSALLGKSKLIGLVAGVSLALLIGCLAFPRLTGPPRCKFADPGDLPKLEHPAGYVYVIHDSEFSQRYKIGRTRDPATRMKAIYNILPGESDIVAIIKTADALELEKRLHDRFARQWMRGEWFALDRQHVMEICKI